VTFEIGLVLGILAAALVLFVTEVIPMDLVALLVLATLSVSGLVSPAAALAGFSNPAVVTVWAMFILSAGLTRSGVAEILGRLILSGTGRGEAGTVMVIVLTSAVLSAFMNNIGVAALMLPAVVGIARRSGTAPSRLLMPLAFGSLLGGLTTLIGTPPNLLVSEALREHGLEPFTMFDFTPVGGAVLLAGAAFLALFGRHLLPRRDPASEASPQGPRELARQYRIDERAVVFRIPTDSTLAGRSLRDSRLGSGARLNAYAIQRAETLFPAPSPDFRLEADDRLLIEGKLDRFEELRGWRQLVVEEGTGAADAVFSGKIGLAELRIAPGASIAGQTIAQVDFRARLGAMVLTLLRDSTVQHRELATTPLREGDRLLVQGERGRLEALRESRDFECADAPSEQELIRIYDLQARVFDIRVPSGSLLEGKGLAESRIGDALGVGVLGVRRAGELIPLPGPDERLQADDVLLVRGTRTDLDIFRGLQGLELETEGAPDVGALERDGAVLVEALLSPRTTLAGKTLTELRFRARYGLQLLAVLRRGEVRRSNLRDVALEFGDALLLIGPPERAALLAGDPDFLLMARDLERSPDRRRAPLAAAIMAAVVIPVLLGWLPIAVSAVAGATLMVLTRCLSMDDAYRSIEWRSIFLIAGMLPLGTALADTGAARLVAESVVGSVGPYGPWAVLAALYFATAAATTVIPTAALVVLMAPIALTASATTGLSPHAVMMAIAMAASASFTSPVSHPANVLVMGPGGYRFADYLKLGIPLTLAVFVVVMVVLPWFWPLAG